MVHCQLFPTNYYPREASKVDAAELLVAFDPYPFWKRIVREIEECKAGETRARK